MKFKVKNLYSTAGTLQLAIGQW